MKKIIFSIIIPVYNAEKYICECLDSLLSQNIPCDEYEIICIDDGSVDDSGAILDGYAQKYNNITVIHKNNSGVSTARNCGINTAEGRYIWFVDADDFIKQNCLEELKNLAAANYDIINIKAYTFNENLNEKEINLIKSNGLIPNIDYWGFVCLHLYKTEIIKSNKIKFNETIKYGEDEMFYNDVYSFSENHINLDDIYYFYRKNSSSAMNSIKSYKKHKDYFQSVFLSAVILKKGLEDKTYTKDFTCDFLRRRYKVCAHALSRLKLKNAKQKINEMKKSGFFDTEALPSNSYLDYKTFKKIYKKLYLKRLPSIMQKKAVSFIKKLLPKKINQLLKSAINSK